jgi:sodium-coupled neutral amino acid transporter 9
MFMLVSRNEEGSALQIYGLNFGVLVVCTLFAVLLPSIGNIIRYSGAGCGAVVVFVLPSCVFLASKKKEQKLTFLNVTIHIVIILLGLANFFVQFAI